MNLGRHESAFFKILMLEFVSLFCCFFSLFCYATQHDDIVIRSNLHVFPIVYTGVTYSIVASRVNGACANDHNDFHILSLNVQNLVTYSRLLTICLPPGYILVQFCLQETWQSSDADISMFHTPGYKLIHHDFRCTKHGELIVMLMKNTRTNCKTYTTSRMCGEVFSLMLMGIT